jgi:hypothetical protein
MSDELTPALTPEEWADVSRGRAPDGMRVWIDQKNGTVDVDSSGGEWAPRSEPAAKMLALANAALPDDSPYRLSHEDVRAILAARIAYPVGSASHRQLVGIARRLAALLQPYLALEQDIERAMAPYDLAAVLPPETP